MGRRPIPGTTSFPLACDVVDDAVDTDEDARGNNNDDDTFLGDADADVDADGDVDSAALGDRPVFRGSSTPQQYCFTKARNRLSLRIDRWTAPSSSSTVTSTLESSHERQWTKLQYGTVPSPQHRRCCSTAKPGTLWSVSFVS